MSEIGSSPDYKDSFWWTGATDFSKRGAGTFTWEQSGREVGAGAGLWANSSGAGAVAGVAAGDSHRCVYLGPSNSSAAPLLDHADCRDAVARPLCQYLVH